MTTSSSHQPDALPSMVGAGSAPGTVTALTRRGRRAPGRRVSPAGGPADGRHVLLVGPDEVGDRGAGAHTAGLADHLARSAASVSVLAAGSRAPGLARRAGPVSPPAGLLLSAAGGGAVDPDGAPDGTGIVRVRRQPAAGDRGRRWVGDGLGFLTGALTATLPHVPDVVLGITPGLGGAVAAARIARRHRVPFVLVVHDLVSARPDGATGRGLTVAAATERRLLRAAAELAVTSPEAAEHLYALGIAPEHVHLLPHWAPEAAGPNDRLAARRALGWPLRPFTVVLSAGADARPDLVTVQAAAELLHGEAQVVVLGEGTRRALVPAQAAGPDRVRRVGPLPDAGYHQALAAADLLLTADRPDATGLPMPGTLAHYLAAGRPVLAAVRETGSVAAELDRSAGAGLVVRPGDPRLAAAAIRALLLDHPLRAAMGRAGERYAAERLSRTGTMRQLDALLRSALGETVVDLTTAL